MHNNYYFLRQLSPEIEKRIVGFTLVSCFSQNKDELITEFNNGNHSFFIKASLLGEFQCLSFPATFNRARKNSIDLFNDLLMNKVIGIRQFANERSFGIVLENNKTLVYKMHAARANVLCFGGESVTEIFRKNFNADQEIRLNELDRNIDWSGEAFQSNPGEYKTRYFTFGKPVWEYVDDQGFREMDAHTQWSYLQDIRKKLEHPEIYMVENKGIVSLNLLPVAHARKIEGSPVEVLNEFFNLKISVTAFEKEKTSHLAFLQGQLKQSVSFLAKSKQKLSELDADLHYQQWADLIMANLHAIKPGQENITLADFHDQHPVSIKLNKELTPPKNAEVFYRKAKNKSIEINTLKNAVDHKEKEIQVLKHSLDLTIAAKNLVELKEISGTRKTMAADRQEKAAVPYHEFEYKGFKIWVGKNAAANDKLTLKHSFKDDLWLHAKDVAGSHVLVKYQSGKPFPKDVIARAAQLAAYYSKRKNESLCPVAVTSKKFVRKRKGDPAGRVVVEREDVIMVEPGK